MCLQARCESYEEAAGGDCCVYVCAFVYVYIVSWLRRPQEMTVVCMCLYIYMCFAHPCRTPIHTYVHTYTYTHTCRCILNVHTHIYMYTCTGLSDDSSSIYKYMLPSMPSTSGDATATGQTYGASPFLTREQVCKLCLFKGLYLSCVSCYTHALSSLPFDRIQIRVWKCVWKHAQSIDSCEQGNTQ